MGAGLVVGSCVRLFLHLQYQKTKPPIRAPNTATPPTAMPVIALVDILLFSAVPVLVAEQDAVQALCSSAVVALVSDSDADEDAVALIEGVANLVTPAVTVGVGLSPNALIVHFVPSPSPALNVGFKVSSSRSRKMLEPV